MGYIGSYIWKIRQKVGNDEIISAATDTVPIRDGKVCMAFNKDYQAWVFPGGHAELGRTWEEAARAELFEEAGLTAKDEDMKAFAAISGYRLTYGNGDTIWDAYKKYLETGAFQQVVLRNL